MDNHICTSHLADTNTQTDTSDIAKARGDGDMLKTNRQRNVIEVSLGCKCVSNDNQSAPVVKRNYTPVHKSWLRAYVIVKAGSARCPVCLSSMIVSTQLEAGFYARYYTSPVSIVPTG
ncbi:hypothetical protein TNCV_117881 [Trichonephila clavipes]|nr:hypothetical protein TNCV_117881 [Trichonephila clavipes]